MIGKILGGRYEILEKIGSGGMAVVYLAHCNKLNRKVAVKILKPELSNDKEFVARFNTEAQAAGRLSHPNIVSIFDFGHENNLYYIVMEYVEGKTLKEYINDNILLPWREAVEFTIQICKGLEHAHKNGVVHRDIKPHNIILTNDGVLKVTDFGIARAGNASASTLTMSGNTIGSVHYFSPEQARGGYTDSRSDLYSLGIVLYEMTTGQLPFDGDSAVSIAIKQIQEKPIHPKELNISIPLSVETIILKAMNKEQSTRYQSASEMMDDLEKVLKDPSRVPVEIQKTEDSKTQRMRTVKAENITPVEPERKPPVEIYNKNDFADDYYEYKRPPQKNKDNNRSNNKMIVTAIILASLLLVALIVGGVAIFGNKSGKIEVPDIVGEDYETVKMQYQDNDDIIIIKGEEVESDEYAEGKIVSQDPKAGKMASSPVEITVNISKGQQSITINNYKNREISEVQAILENKGLIVTIEETESDDVSENKVVKTSPGEDSIMHKGEKITVYVSKGSNAKEVEVPNLIGDSLSTAKSKISDSGLSLGTIEGNSENGTVTSQSIEANSKVKEGTVINITFSEGKSDHVATQVKEKTISFDVPQNKAQTQIKVTQNGKVIHDDMHDKSEGTFSVSVVGSGKITLEYYYDGVFKGVRTITL